MAAPVTEKFEQMVLEISTDNGNTWARICAMEDVTLTRTLNVDTDEVPADCDDESKPYETVRDARSLDVTVSAEGKWATASHETLVNWFYGADPAGFERLIRIGNLAVTTEGNVQYERGNALLTTLSQSRTKGQRVTASIELQFTGTPTLDVVPAA